MKSIICGAGVVGESIAEKLSKEGIEVTVIDESKERVKKISDSLDVKTILGAASLPSILSSAGANDCDILIAVTKSDVKTGVWGNKPNPYDVNWNSENPENPCIDACVNTKSIIEFDLKNKTFGKFQLALQMKEKKESVSGEDLLDDENPLGEYSLRSMLYCGTW